MTLLEAGKTYSRNELYEILRVPDSQRRGNWETGYNKYKGDLYIFCNVGAEGRLGHNYDNRWLTSDRLQWFAKERTHVNQKQIQWMLNPKGNILIFTRTENRLPFKLEGYAKPFEHDATTPVRIVWRISTAPTLTPPANYILANRREIKNRNYVRIATNRYWFGFDRTRIDSYKARFGDDFALVLVGDANLASDYYFIPYEAVAHLLTDDNATEHSGGRVRWIGDIQQHRFRVSRCKSRVDVGQFYGIPLAGESEALTDSLDNEYAIESRTAEIKQRVKQSVFRQKVLENFNGRRCISGLVESDLLIASHIVPWAKRVDCRLDPLNGLCLSVFYDALFDADYFTITDGLRIQTANSPEFSDVLREALSAISGTLIHPPKKALRLEYLAFHRDNVFRG